MNVNTWGAVNTWEDQVSTGGVPKRKKRREYLSLPDGTIVEVSSRAEAEQLLALYYEAEKPEKAKPKLKQKTLPKPKGRPKAQTPERVVYYPTSVKPVNPSNIASTALFEARLKRKIRQRQDEEALLLLL